MAYDLGRQEGETAAEWLVRHEATSPDRLPHAERNNFNLALAVAEEAVRQEQQQARTATRPRPSPLTEIETDTQPGETVSAALQLAQAAVRALSPQERGQLQLWMLRGMTD